MDTGELKQLVLSASAMMDMFGKTYLGILDGETITLDQKNEAAEAFYLLQDLIASLQTQLGREYSK